MNRVRSWDVFRGGGGFEASGLGGVGVGSDGEGE